MILEFRLTGSGQKTILNQKPESLTLSLDEEEIYSFDAEGRMLTAWKEGLTYVRTFNNRLINKYRDPAGRFPWKLIREKSGAEKSRVLHHAYQSARRVCEGLRRGRIEWLCGQEKHEQNPERTLSMLDRIGSWDELRLEGERERFSAVYRPVNILPPDQYYALVLQATEGCHWNRCRFCSFYDQTRFHIKSAVEFSAHLQAVRQFMGLSIRLRRSLFLGDANALVIPQEKLIEIFSMVNAEFLFRNQGVPAGGNGLFFDGIFSFMDSFAGERKCASDFAALKQLNLKRVYLGVESGSDELLELLQKPASSHQAKTMVSELKEAGVGVGVIILVGVGGKRFCRQHIESTIRLLNDLPWQKGDFLYFSPLWVQEGSKYNQASREADWDPLSSEEMLAQWQEIRSRLDFSKFTPPQIALYDIREFVY
jgi:hypothetical protein